MAIEPLNASTNQLEIRPSFLSTENWVNRTGKNVSVALVDSGVDQTHPQLTGKIRASFSPKKEGTRIVFAETGNGDRAGHGTACAGIINSIAPDAEITCINVLGERGMGDGFAFLAGLEFAIKNRFRIINLSLGTTIPQLVTPLRELLDRAYQAGCIVVAAANNLPQPSFPSVFSSSVISVSKSIESDPLKFSFSFGEVIELTAPGVNVRTTWLNGGYRKLTGNSFACPHITGIIARILESDSNLTPFEVKSILYRVAQENTSNKT